MGARRGLQQAMRAAGLPDEVLLDTPRVVLSGMDRLMLENHRGVIECARDVVRVRVEGGELCVRGAELSLSRLRPGLLIVDGALEQVSFQRAEGQP